jgi:hypothetical protein
VPVVSRGVRRDTEPTLLTVIGGPVPDSANSLPPPLLARSQLAQVAIDEANARKAAADADNSALTLAQSKYKSLVPDLTGVSTNAIDDKSADVAFAGRVTYAALANVAAKMTEVAGRLLSPLPKSSDVAECSILVTSQSDLLTDDLMRISVAESLAELKAFADNVLGCTAPSGAGQPAVVDGGAAGSQDLLPRPQPAEVAAAVPAAAGLGLAAAGVAAFGPFGIAAAAAAAIPSIVSLFSATTTAKSEAETISDLAVTTAVVTALRDDEKLRGYVAVHEDFRFAPVSSAIRQSCRELAGKRAALVIRQDQVQLAKNQADLVLAKAVAQDAAWKASHPKPGDDGAGHVPGPPEDPQITEQIDGATRASADGAAALSLISAALASIDSFTSVVNTTAVGARSPLAIAMLSEQLHGGDNRIAYVLSVKSLAAQAQEHIKDRKVWWDTYTSMADVSVAFLLYDTRNQKIITSGVFTGSSSVHGRFNNSLRGSSLGRPSLLPRSKPTIQSGQ